MAVFAPENILKPTPPILKNIFNILLYLTGVWVYITPAFHLSHATTFAIDEWSIKTLALMRFTIEFFHFDFKIDPNEPQPTQSNQ